MQTAATSPQQRPTGMWCTRWKRPVAPPRSSRNAAQRMSGRQHDVNEHPELAQFLHARSVTRALVDQLCTACAERIMTAKVSLDEQRGAYEGGSAALRWGRDVRQREPGLNTYQLRLMAACTVATALNDGREQVGGGGREGIIAVSTRHVRLQTAKDSDADTSRERGIDEISAG